MHIRIDRSLAIWNHVSAWRRCVLLLRYTTELKALSTQKSWSNIESRASATSRAHWKGQQSYMTPANKQTSCVLQTSKPFACCKQANFLRAANKQTSCVLQTSKPLACCKQANLLRAACKSATQQCNLYRTSTMAILTTNHTPSYLSLNVCIHAHTDQMLVAMPVSAQQAVRLCRAASIVGQVPMRHYPLPDTPSDALHLELQVCAILHVCERDNVYACVHVCIRRCTCVCVYARVLVDTCHCLCVLFWVCVQRTGVLDVGGDGPAAGARASHPGMPACFASSTVSLPHQSAH